MHEMTQQRYANVLMTCFAKKSL